MDQTMAIPPRLVNSSISLPHKSDAPIEYSFVPPHHSRERSLLVFLNGLMLPQSGWMPVISHLVQKYPEHPALLSYDRYGQGRTIARDPADKGKEPGHGHDLTDVVNDLYYLIPQVISSQTPGATHPHLIFVANSIGCPVARLFAHAYPGTVKGIVMLDSNMTNNDFVSLFPDPDAENFRLYELPEGVTASELRAARSKYGQLFHPDVKNPEGLSRRNVPDLLPYANSPVLQGVGGKHPLVTVVGHDPHYFAKESLQGSLATPIALSMNYTNPAWQRYNEGLVEIAGDRGHGPIIAKDCGHFIQRDDPEFVADLICDMLDNLEDD